MTLKYFSKIVLLRNPEDTGLADLLSIPQRLLSCPFPAYLSLKKRRNNNIGFMYTY